MTFSKEEYELLYNLCTREMAMLASGKKYFGVREAEFQKVKYLAMKLEVLKK